MSNLPLFVRACLGETVERTPVWMMRQAGRYLPEYRALRERYDFLTSCRTPDVAAEITMQPVRRLGVDAAILFSDILVPLPGMGVEVDFNPGPVLRSPVATPADVERLRLADPEESTGYVLDAIRLLRSMLPRDVPLIGFAGAPFTVATYLVEGRGSKSFSRLKTLLFADPETARRLLDRTTETLAAYAAAQVRAGAQAFMLFDTWAGLLAPDDYATFAAPYARRVFDAVGAASAAGREPVPRIYYAGDAGGFLERCGGLGAEVIGVDWRTDLGDARRRLGGTFVVQGNLDPAVLFAPPDIIRARARRVLESARGGSLLVAGGDPRPEGGTAPSQGHVFNLGHGILPTTPPDHAKALVDAVREISDVAGSR